MPPTKQTAASVLHGCNSCKHATMHGHACVNLAPKGTLLGLRYYVLQVRVHSQLMHAMMAIVEEATQVQVK